MENDTYVSPFGKDDDDDEERSDGDDLMRESENEDEILESINSISNFAKLRCRSFFFFFFFLFSCFMIRKMVASLPSTAKCSGKARKTYYIV